MNFISQSWESLTSGGKIYILFQALYIALGAFFLYVQVQILGELRKRNRKPDIEQKDWYPPTTNRWQ